MTAEISTDTTHGTRTTVRNPVGFECAPEGAVNTSRDGLPHPSRPEGADVTILAPAHDKTPPPPPVDATNTQLRRLLAESIRAREWAVNRVFDLEKHGVRHWFVDDGSGYCAACNLPEANFRHAPRSGDL